MTTPDTESTIVSLVEIFDKIPHEVYKMRFIHELDPEGIEETILNGFKKHPGSVTEMLENMFSLCSVQKTGDRTTEKSAEKLRAIIKDIHKPFINVIDKIQAGDNSVQ